MPLSNKCRSYLVTIVVLSVGIAVGVGITQVLPLFERDEKTSWDFADNKINFSRTVALKVGQSMVIHGKRGKCGELPQSAEKTLAKLPTDLKTGKLRVGELGVRSSRSCNGITPAREVIFDAIQPGSEIIRLYGDDIVVTVEAE